MPSYDMVVLGEKSPVVFDLGSACIKCGFAGEANPRFMIESPIYSIDLKSSNFKVFLKNLFHILYFKYLIVNPKDRRVVLVLSLGASTKFKDTIANLLFNHFEVPSLVFAPTHVLSLLTLGVPTALVLDVGYVEALTLPVYEGFTIIKAWQAAQLGSKHIHNELRSLISESAFAIEDSGEKIPFSECLGIDLPDDILEDIKVKTCFISPMARAALWNNWRTLASDGNEQGVPVPEYAEEYFKFPLASHGGKCLFIPSRIREMAVECLFTGDADNITLQTLILESLLLSPIDCRRSLIENIICIGGTCMIPGFLERLNEEIKTALEISRYSQLASLRDHIRFHNPPSMANYTGWLGGSIFGALESLPGRSVNRSTYLEKGSVSILSNSFDAAENAEEKDLLFTR